MGAKGIGVDLHNPFENNVLGVFHLKRQSTGMRLLQSLTIMAVVLSSTACGNATTAPRPNVASAACQVAAAYAESVIVEAKGKPVVFTTNDETFSGPVSGGEWWKMDGERPQSAAPPATALVKRLEAQGNRNAVSRCALVRQVLDSRRISYGSKAVDAVSSPNPSELFKASIHTISMPVVSADGQQAVLASSGVSGPLAGGGFLQFLGRQPDGRWKVVAFSPLWVA